MTEEDPWARWPYIAFEIGQKLIEAFGNELTARDAELSQNREQMTIFMSAYASALMHAAAEICIEDGMPEDTFFHMAQGAWRDTVKDLAEIPQSQGSGADDLK